MANERDYIAEIQEINSTVSQYFASTGQSQEYYKKPSNNVNALQGQLDDQRIGKENKDTSITATIIADQQTELDRKLAEVEMLKDQLTIMDVKIDRFDALIQNIDKDIIPLIDEINVAITAVKTAYDARITAGCKSDLHWEVIGTNEYEFEGLSFSETIYECKKNPNVRTDYGYYGAKYYRKPQNQDYGANIVKEFLGTISVGSASLAILSNDGTFNLQVGDTITDNIDNPTVFSSNPSIVGFGTTAIVGTSTQFSGTISVGSTIIASTGIGTTGNVNVGDTISLSGVLALNTTVVGFGTTTTSQTVWNPGLGTTTVLTTQTTAGQTVGIGSTVIFVDSISGVSAGSSLSINGKLTNVPVVSVGNTFVRIGTANTIASTIGPGIAATFRTFNGFISTSVSVPSLIVSVAAIGSTTNGTFAVGILSTFPSLILSDASIEAATNTNFTCIRTTQTEATTFDYSNNPIDPVTVGIMGNDTLGLGHKLIRVNNGSPVGPFQWKEVMTSSFEDKTDAQLNDSERYLRTAYPEPACGASYARYYPGNNLWPTKSAFTYDFGGSPTSSSSSYANEGDIVAVGTGLGAISSFGVGTANVSSINPSAGTCNPLNTAITTAETSRDAIIARNTPKIDSLIASSSALRSIRDKMEGQAFAVLQGRVYGDVEINKLKTELAALRATDLKQYEPPTYYFNPDTGKTSSSTVGVDVGNSTSSNGLVVSGLVFNLDAGNPQSYSGSGTNWIDISGSGKNGTLVNGPTYSTANSGSIVFDGTNDYVTSGALSGSFVSFTVIIWFYPTSVTNYQNPIDCNYSYNGSTGNIGPRLEMNNSGTLAWNYSNDTAINQNFYTHLVVSSGLSANTWYCAAITYDGNTNSSTTYYNGNNTGLSRTTVGTPPTGFVGTMNNITLGKGFHLGGAERIYAGRVSNTQIYNRALTASEITQNFNALRGRFGL